MKVARAYTRRPGNIASEGTFHGRTLLTIILTSKHDPFRAKFGPYAPAVHRVPFVYCYWCPFKLSYPARNIASTQPLAEMLKGSLPPEGVAAVIAEPILGEGGLSSRRGNFGLS